MKFALHVSFIKYLDYVYKYVYVMIYMIVFLVILYQVFEWWAVRNIINVEANREIGELYYELKNGSPA